jgi:hypothetical protein
MKTFLQELAEKIYKQHPVPGDVTIVFPNRRAALYFRKHFSNLINKPVFAPKLVTIEDFISGFSVLKVPDKLELIYALFKVVRTTSAFGKEGEGVDQFYFWGDMLLKDFDEIDKCMVDAVHLFKDLSHQKELDSSFDFLTDEQREFLQNFWSNFDVQDSANKKKFLYLWRKLPEVYAAFKDQLLQKGLAYEGMLHRLVAEKCALGRLVVDVAPEKIHFAGFNALTSAEEKILSFFVDKGSHVHWDLDEYYVNNITQEAGRFFREYQEHPSLKKTFSTDVPANFSQKVQRGQKLKMYGAAQPIGQAKLMAQTLSEEFKKGLIPEETLIVLPDEKLLLPVLHGIPVDFEKLNVTMGFPLSSTPLFNFLELIIDLQIQRKADHFNHRQVLAVIGHPYVVAADAASSNAKRKEILRANWVHIPKNFLATEVEIHRIIFQELDFADGKSTLTILITYLKSIITEIGSLKTIGDLDKEYAFHFLKFFNRIQEVFGEDDHDAKKPLLRAEYVQQLKSFLRLFRQLINAHKIPFSGEPLRGLQIMGVLETRNLDYKNVFVLSLNEGSFPSISSKGSYIPFSIRKAYKLPTVEHQDAIYSYLFYRVLQRSENIFLFYNSETDVLGQGETSRYLQQLVYESGIQIEKKVLHNPLRPLAVQPISISKNREVMENLLKINEGNAYFKGISPSALNTYLECQLKFYFRHVARIKEADEVEEELDARVLGNFLHDVMERFYKRIIQKKGQSQIDESDFQDYEPVIDQLIDQVFIEAYRLDPTKRVQYEGQRLVVREVVKRFAHRIVEMDRAYAPFSIEAIEQEGLSFAVSIEKPPYRAVVGGKIDRVDKKGQLVRVIDYKTGKDKLNFDSVKSLFGRDSSRNKAAFQTLLYALLYKRYLLQSHGLSNEIKIIPGLINRMNLFEDGFSFGLRVGKEQITNVDTLLPDFEQELKILFEELYDPNVPFHQTKDIEHCKLCAYTQICYR